MILTLGSACQLNLYVYDGVSKFVARATHCHNINLLAWLPERLTGGIHDIRIWLNIRIRLSKDC